MSRNVKNTGTQFSDLPGVTPLSTEELNQIRGGFQATLLRAMGWKSYDSKAWDKNGNMSTSRVWVPPKQS